MDANIAHALARHVHKGQLSRSGEPVIDHVERVARAVPQDSRALAYLHDVLERSSASLRKLREHGLTDAEHSVLELLTREISESYEAYVMRIARASGDQGRLARTIKLADLNDNLCHRTTADCPDYAWARRQITGSQERHGESLAAASKVREAVRTAA